MMVALWGQDGVTVLTPTMLQPADADSIGRGATLALRCTMCHGARGLRQANSPNLAGQYPFYIYKELETSRPAPG